MTREPGQEWVGLHLFFEGSIYLETADRILLENVAPFVQDCQDQEWIRGWFFIRYYEQGCHLRVRFLGHPEVLADRLRPRADEHFSTPVAQELIERVEWTPYEPEVERYGGPHGVLLAEQLFQDASETALALLRKVPAADRPTRLGKAMLAMLVMLHSFQQDLELAAQLVHSYGRNYLRTLVPDPALQERWHQTFEQGFNRQADRLADYVEVAWAALAAGQELTGELDVYREKTRATAHRMQRLAGRSLLQESGETTDDWPRLMHRIVPSYIHMMNNRLGVNIQEECYLSVLIYLTLMGIPQPA